MIQTTTRISKGYQITLPSALRRAFHLEAGDEIVVEESKDGILIKKALTREEKVKEGFARLDEWRESLPGEAKEKIREYAGWTASQYREHIDNLPETKVYMKEKYGI